jgi:ketosteroid isomerase-like protein
MHQIISDFCSFYRDLDQKPLSQLKDIYSADVRFCDPVHSIQGIDSLTRYFEDLMQQVKACSFDIREISETGNTAFVRWTMHLQHPKLKGGQAILVEGVSYLEFDAKITLHQDYFDLGAMLYEHLPVIGRLVKYVKSSLAAD